MSKFKGGIPDLAVLALVAGLVVGSLAFLVYLQEFEIVKGYAKAVAYDVELDIKAIDEGTTLNSLLVLDKGGRYSEILGMKTVNGFSGDDSDVKETLKKLEISLGMSSLNRGYEIGDFDKDFAVYAEFPLPGRQKGRLGLE